MAMLYLVLVKQIYFTMDNGYEPNLWGKRQAKIEQILIFAFR